MNAIRPLTLPNYSGEFFDLSIPSTNDKFGAMHNIGINSYGINFPLEKFIKELEEIINGESDDKTKKRKLRLSFLKFCKIPLLESFFTSLCNYLNGKSGSGEQHIAYFVVTAAGGNIIIVFAQLIMNIIDSYRAAAAATAASALDMFNSLLMPTNKRLITILLTKIPNIDSLSIVRLIVAHFESDLEKYKELKEIAESPTSDCDFKLSPNKSNLSFDIDMAGVVRRIQQLEVEQADTAATQSIRSNPCGPPSRYGIKAGFLLFRIKSLIDCRFSYTQQHTPAELKLFKNACASVTKYKDLYPQIITQQHLKDADREGVNSNCLKYLEHLYEKKETIKDMTQLTINEAIEYELVGVSKQSNADGSTFATIPPAINKTEAIIRYIRRITETMNAYIQQKWEPTQEGLTYQSVWSNFESLNNIINCHTNRIPYLAAQIVIQFLNYPDFNSENILDNLIESFNKKNGSNCTMLPVDVLLVPSKEYTDLCYHPLVPIKQFIEATMHSSLGFPDGVRITINALVSDDKQKINIRDIDLEALNEMEKQASPEEDKRQRQPQRDEQQRQRQRDEQQQQRLRDDPNTTKLRRDDKTKSVDRDRDTESDDSDDSDDSDNSDYGYGRMGRGGYNRGKKKFTLKNKKMVKNIKVVKKTQEKLKTKPKKTRRQKNLRKVTLKHKKSRKHKSMKHKQRQNKI